MAQGALGAAGERRVGYGLEVGRSVRTAGGAGAHCVATRTACYYYYYGLFFPKITPGRAGSPEEPVATGGAIFLHAGYRSCHSTVPQC